MGEKSISGMGCWQRGVLATAAVCVCALVLYAGLTENRPRGATTSRTTELLRSKPSFATGYEQLAAVIHRANKQQLVHVDSDFDAAKCNTDCTKAISMCMLLNPTGLAKAYKPTKIWCDGNARGGEGRSCCNKWVALQVGGCK